jgi:hypothetical protein
MSLALQRHVQNLEVDERILHPLLTLLVQAVFLGSGHENSIAREFLCHVGALDAVAETEFQPSDDIVRWLRSLPTETPPIPGDHLSEDVEMREVGEEQEELARESPESEEEPDVGDGRT